MRALAALAIVLTACGDPAPPAAASLSALGTEAGPLDALNRRHARLRERMRTRGYGDDVGLTRELVLEDRGVAIPLDLPVGRCATFLALGGGTIRELALVLYDGEGAETAADSVPGEGGLVHACPQSDSGAKRLPFYLVLDAREGAGAVMVAQFGSELDEGEGFDGLFEGVLEPRVPFRDVEAHLARSRGALRARGFTPLGAPVLERVTEGAVVRVPVELEGGRCYVAMGRGDGVRDIDLFLFDAAGVEVDRDLAGDAEPSIELCPAAGGRHTVELRAFEGAGAVGVAVFAGPGQPDGAPPVVSPGSEPEASTEPSLALQALARPLQDRGFGAPLFVSREAAILPGEVRTHEVVIGPGCGIVAGAASHEGMDLDLYLADESGREVDSDTAVHSTARVRGCRATPTVLRVAVKAYGRDGAYALAVLRAPPAIDSLQALRLEEATAPFRSRGYAQVAAYEAEIEHGVRHRTTLPPLSAGGCVAVAAAGMEDVEDLDLVLRDASGAVITRDSGPEPHAAVSRCAEGDEALVAEVAMYRGAGRVAIRVLSQPADAQPGAPARDAPRPDAPSRTAPPPEERRELR